MEQQEQAGGVIAALENVGTATVADINAAGAAIVGAIEHPIQNVEALAGFAVGAVEAAGEAVKVEFESLVEKVKTYFHTTSKGHLQDALVAIAMRIEALETTVTGMRDFIGK